jgi:hypothetical protein
MSTFVHFVALLEAIVEVDLVFWPVLCPPKSTLNGDFAFHLRRSEH